MPAVKRMVKHPETGKRLDRVFINGKGWFGWNTAFHVYNNIDTYEQLDAKDVPAINFDLSGADLTRKQAEHIQFISALTDQIRDGIIRDIKAGKVPEDWDGIELRWLLSERSDSNFGTQQTSRKRAYRNTIIVNNL